MSYRIPSCIFLTIVTLAASALGQDTEVSIAAAPSTKRLLTSVATAIKEKKGIQIDVSANYAGVDALEAVSTGKVNIAIMTKPIGGVERSQYPSASFVSIPVGMEVVALGVSDDVWEAGVRMISRDSMRGIYEKKITNWKELGGPDETITLFNFQQGQGTWELFAEWLYGDNRKAPLPKTEKVVSSEDARAALELNAGSISPLAAALVDDSRCHALAIDLGESLAKPTNDYVAAGTYPIVRPIIAVVVGRPALGIRVVTEFLTGPDGQDLVRKAGDLGLGAVPKPTPNPYY
jgi:phosphate transport system substrate-binding protein